MRPPILCHTILLTAGCTAATIYSQGDYNKGTDAAEVPPIESGHRVQ
jgi:hypothetical protein